MEGWTEDEFRRVARNTRISKRTLEACKDVLVDGLSGIAAAEKHKMFAPQISRAITTLREKQAEMMEFAAVCKDADEMLQYMATEVAKALYGQDFQCALAQPGQLYEGPLVVQSKGYLVQKVGRIGILHDVSRFEDIPPLHADLRIAYDKAGGLAKVSAVQAQEKGKGPER
ncbi:KfrB domain-containing protein [Cupriavidus nantongensis]|uniref:KfrB domain-containing protein n=1 Tax=Cupriavidus nantongensis TaxID=1796606 RepID=A0A142JIY6_9BURK|nr:hypothetical protein [Cupriavidus nantongensis]AMR78048.1 hypothetical protein A2G96_09995 [Cupriavidus nantongensis]